MVAATGSHALRVDFVNANSIQPQAEASASTDSQFATLARVTYAGLWEKVSLEYAASAGSIYTTTYTLAPGADAKNIRLRSITPRCVWMRRATCASRSRWPNPHRLPGRRLTAGAHP